MYFCIFNGFIISKNCFVNRQCINSGIDKPKSYPNAAPKSIPITKLNNYLYILGVVIMVLH